MRAPPSAVQEARSHGARLVAVPVVEPSYLYGVELPSVAPDREPVEEAEAELERIVDRVLRGDEAIDVERRVEVSGSRVWCSDPSVSTWSPTRTAP